MSVEEIKSRIVELSPAEQGEVTAFLFHLRHAADADGLEDRMDEEVWLKSASAIGAFAFLAAPAENIYTAEDGEPFHDEV